jgi:hypothetical protein
MGEVRKARWWLGLALLAGPAARAEPPIREASWEQPEHLRGYVVRVYHSDGTPPAESKGLGPQVTVPHPAELQPAGLQLPILRAMNGSLPVLPHGYRDPTHPIGPAEPGSAAPKRIGPGSSGLTLPLRR